MIQLSSESVLPPQSEMNPPCHSGFNRPAVGMSYLQLIDHLLVINVTYQSKSYTHICSCLQISINNAIQDLRLIRVHSNHWSISHVSKFSQFAIQHNGRVVSLVLTTSHLTQMNSINHDFSQLLQKYILDPLTSKHT